MEISNSTGQSTLFRVTGSGRVNSASRNAMLMSGGNSATLEILECGVLNPLQGQSSGTGGSEGWTVEFYIDDRLVASRSFSSPPALVDLKEGEGRYWVDAELEAPTSADALSPDLTLAIEHLSTLSDRELEWAARNHLPEESAARLEELHWKRDREGLNEAEARELSHLVALYERTMLVRAQAAMLLRQRGHELTLSDIAG
jgi:hypothetical protein